MWSIVMVARLMIGPRALYLKMTRWTVRVRHNQEDHALTANTTPRDLSSETRPDDRAGLTRTPAGPGPTAGEHGPALVHCVPGQAIPLSHLENRDPRQI